MGSTEVLVDQYAQGLGPLLEKSGVTWAKLTGSTPASERETILERFGLGLDFGVLWHACAACG